MPTLTSEDIADLTLGTLADLGENKWTDLTSDLQEHIAANELINENKFKIDSGKKIEFSAMIGNNASARWVGLNEPDNVGFGDNMKRPSVDWRHITCNMAIEERLVTMNASPRKIYDYVKEQKAGAMVAWIEKFEEAFWSKPTDDTDEVLPFGVKYWIVTNSYTTTPAIAGGNPTGFTSGCAGLSSSTYTRWKNGNVQYVAVTKVDLMRKLRKLAKLCNFKPPVAMPTYDRGKGYGYYTTLDNQSAMEELAENQNDRLGTDLASMDGKVLFRRSPVEWAPFLDADTSAPFYGIHWGSFEVNYLAGEWMHQTGPKQAPGEHRTQHTHWDSSLNFVCKNRRRNFVAAL